MILLEARIPPGTQRLLVLSRWHIRLRPQKRPRGLNQANLAVQSSSAALLGSGLNRDAFAAGADKSLLYKLRARSGGGRRGVGSRGQSAVAARGRKAVAAASDFGPLDDCRMVFSSFSSPDSNTGLRMAALFGCRL